MAVYHRIASTRWAASMMDGEGARRNGGRWSPPGLAVVYLGDSRALCALEILVHAGRDVIQLDWAALQVNVPDRLIEKVNPGDLPKGWERLPSSPASRKFGADWIANSKKPAILLPSAIIPEEHVLMVNVHHADFGKLKIGEVGRFLFDQRLG